jgi:hypothetical protein
MERAMRRTRAKNTTTKTLANKAINKPLPGTPPLSDFTILQEESVAHLEKVAQDSCVVFSSTMGSPAQLLSMIQARELAQAELALARHKLALQKTAEEAATVCPPSGSGAGRAEGTEEASSGEQELAVEGDAPPGAPTRKKKKLSHVPVGHRPVVSQ